MPDIQSIKEVVSNENADVMQSLAVCQRRVALKRGEGKGPRGSEKRLKMERKGDKNEERDFVGASSSNQ